MKNFKNIFTLLVVALAGLSLTGCSNNDLDTDQFQGGVALNVYGPSPVMRGGQLRFIGSNLDQVREVIIPADIHITNIQVVRAGTPSEIRITVPKDGPVEGLVTLITNSDQRITTRTELKYEEGIEITGMPTKAMPGETIKIEGDYLNLIHSLAFADNVLVSETDFVSHDRYAIEVKVPEEAKTGKLELYTADLTVVDKNSVEYQIIKTDDALEIGTPAIAKVKGREEAAALGNIVAKAGEKITITGTYFNVVADVTVGGVSATDITISEDGTTLTATLPAAAPSGDILIVCKSGIEVPVGTLTTVKPTNAVATPNPVKAGQALTINGQDMDVVSAVQFEGADAVSGDNLTIAADKVIVKAVPETATEGTLKLVMANGETVDVAFTLVKPTITAYNVNPVSAGGALQISGTDLDLVKSITFGEGTATLADDAVSADGKTITVTVPMEATTGKPQFNLANGTSVEGLDLQIDEAVFCYITKMPEFTDDTTPAAGDLFTVPVANAEVLTNVYVNGTDAQFAYSAKTKMLSISIPENATPSSVLKLVSSNGEIEYTIPVIPNTEINTTIWTGAWEIDWGGDLGDDHKSLSALAYGGYDWSAVKEGTDLTVFFTEVEGTWWQMRLGNGSWAALPGTKDQYDFEAGINKFTVTLTADMLKELTNNGGLVITGHGLIISKVVLTEHISLEEVLWKGSEDIDWNVGGALTTLSWGGYDWSSVKAGKILRIYYEKKDASAWGCASLRHGDGWGNLPDNFGAQYDFPEASGVWEITLSQAVIDDLAHNNQGLIITGTNFIIKKVTLE